MVITLGSRRVLGIAYGDMLEVEIELEAEGQAWPSATRNSCSTRSTERGRAACIQLRYSGLLRAIRGYGVCSVPVFLPSHEPAVLFSWGPTEGNRMRNRLRRVLERLRAASRLDRFRGRLAGIRAGQHAQ